MLTVFANIRINDKESLQHLKDSFHSFNTVSDNWLINVRGTLRVPAIEFLTKELGDKIILFQLLDDSRGWIENALQMLPHATHDYLLIWNEDHLNIAPQSELVAIVKEMAERKADYLLHSWWMFGAAHKAFEKLTLEKGKNIDVLRLTEERWQEARHNGHPYYILSLCGIYHKDLFTKILLKDRSKLPMLFSNNLYRGMTLLNRLGIQFPQRKYFHLINKVLDHRLRRFPKETPFDLEKAPDRVDMLPLTMAFSKRELFACIDDDLDVPGYQLIKRGAYPAPSLEEVTLEHEAQENLVSDEQREVLRIPLKKGEEYRRAYYEDSVRTLYLLEERLIVLSGSVNVRMGETQRTLSPHESVSVHPNIGYAITALEDATVAIIFPRRNGGKMRYYGLQGVQKTTI